MSIFDRFRKKIAPPKKTKDKDKGRGSLIVPNPPPPPPPPDSLASFEIIINDDFPGTTSEKLRAELLRLSAIDQVQIVDLRDEQPNPPLPVNGKVKWKIQRGKVVERDPTIIDGITVHQTAVRFSVGAPAIKAAGGDRQLALARRSKGVACHTMAFADGFVAVPNPLTWYVYHGNGFNAKTLGIEIDGDFVGLMNDPTTAYRKKTNPDVLTPELRAAACRGIKFLVDEGRKQGMPIKYIYAHRQSSPTRRSDPGEQIWWEVVIQYAVKELGLEMKPGLIQDKGYNIPKQWDPENGVGDYWDRAKL